MTEKQSGYDALGKVVAAALLVAVSALVNGLVLSRLWAWFVADTFGVQDIGIAQAIGLALLVRFMVVTYDNTGKDKRPFGTLMTEAVMRLVIGNGFVLLIGLAVAQFATT